MLGEFKDLLTSPAWGRCKLSFSAEPPAEEGLMY